MTTPVRAALIAGSPLQRAVKDGAQALERDHRRLIAEEIRASFADSIDLDKALQQGHEEENRWDYLLGHEASQKVIGLEPHTASNHEISTVIKKRRAAIEQLRGHLKPGSSVAQWFWVASGKVDFVPIEKATLHLAQNGITFVGKALHEKHLSSASAIKARTRPRR